LQKTSELSQQFVTKVTKQLRDWLKKRIFCITPALLCGNNASKPRTKQAAERKSIRLKKRQLFKKRTVHRAQPKKTASIHLAVLSDDGAVVRLRRRWMP